MKKKSFFLFSILLMTLSLSAQDNYELKEPSDTSETISNYQLTVPHDSTTIEESERKKKEDIIKKGISFGPLPVVAFDQDKGFQYGALLNIYDFGDGSYYPTPRQQWYIEGSAYTKGSQQYFVTYDTRNLIPRTHMAIAATCMYDKAMDFYGYNGYQTFYDVDKVQEWKKKEDKTGIEPQWMKTFYRAERLAIAAKADFIVDIWENKLFAEGSYYFNWTRMRPINLASINKGKDSLERFSGPTLFELYNEWGIIPESDDDGGFTSAIKLGLMYDTRDYEAAPTKGIWAEAHIMLAPGFLGTSHPYYRYMATFRHYVPIYKEDLVFAYRLNYQGTIGNYLPYYILPVFSNIGREYDRDGIGGYRTVRGLMRDRVMGLDVAFYNVEFRWRFVRFALWKQNIAMGLNIFTDGAIVTRGYNLAYRPSTEIGRAHV